ncbi:MAG TPA: hypothetical protein VGN37_01520 [Actinocatenispora sp.]
MINPSGGGQIIAAGEPFKLRLKKKRQVEAATTPDEPDATADDETDADDTADEDD